MKNIFLSGVAAFVLSIAGTSAFAQEVAANDRASEKTEEAVVVLGHGQSRQTQTLKSIEITQAAPGTSPLKVLDKLPGVTFQAADPFGAYEWSTRISIRGFNQNQLGFTLDGITLGDMSYGNYNGLHVSRAIINEDIARAEMAQGAGSLDSFTSSNLGGTLKFTSRDPAFKMGGELGLTAGSESMHRIYGRFETGSLEAFGGLRGYISYVDHSAEKWKGAGDQNAKQYSTKWVLPIGDNELSAFYNHSERREQDYQDLSIDMINRLGYSWDNFQPNWVLANQVAQAYNTGGSFPAPITTVDDSYYSAAGLRDDTIYGAKGEFKINENASFDISAYHHDNEGQGLWYTPYTVSPGNSLSPFYNPASPSSDNAFISIRTTEYDISRSGVNGNFSYEIGAHKVSIGGWHEDNDFHQARRFYGESLSNPHRDVLGFQSNPFFTQWEYKFNTKTNLFYIQDVWQISEALKVNFGFKSLNVTNEVQTIVGSALSAKIRSKDNFLPQIGAVYKLNNDLEFFGSYSENMNAYVAAATGGPFSSRSQVNVDYVKGHVKPESSKTLEGGLRVRSSNYQASVALYHVNFDNRLLAVAQGPGIVGNAPVLSNVGGVETNGIELAGEYKITPQFKIYASYSYNDSTYSNDVIAQNGTIQAHTNGKTVVNTPKNLFKTELKYENGPFFAKLAINVTGERYYTYENIGGKVPSTTVSDLTLGYELEKYGTSIQLNVTNLTDEKYISTLGSNGFVNNDATGTAQTVLAGAPRQVFIQIKKTF